MFTLQNNDMIYDCIDPGDDSQDIFGDFDKWRINIDVSGPCQDPGDDFYEIFRKCPVNLFDDREINILSSDAGISLTVCIDPIIRHDGPLGNAYTIDWSVQSKKFEAESCGCDTDQYVYFFRHVEDYMLSAGINDTGCDRFPHFGTMSCFSCSTMPSLLGLCIG